MSERRDGGAVAEQENGRPPRDNLFRALRPGLELRMPEEDEERGAAGGGMPELYGHFAVFNEWTEINSIFEGNFLERIAPGAFKKTFREQRDEMRVLFQHGMDFSIGDKPLGPIETLEEDERGAAYAVPLLDTAYNRDLIPGLEADLYGASFRFRVIREELDNEPGTSDYNPEGLPERTIKEAQVFEFGPVTFPAYASATAGVRSLTDEFLFGRLIRDPKRLRELVDFATREEREDDETETEAAPPEGSAEATPHPDRGRRASQRQTLYGLSRGKEKESWRL